MNYVANHESTNGVERPEDAARRYAGEISRLAVALAELDKARWEQERCHRHHEASDAELDETRRTIGRPAGRDGGMSDSSFVVYQPDRGHTCGITPLNYSHDPAGTVRQCAECGRTWVAYPPPRVSPGMQLVLTQWRREGRIARWWRETRGR